MGKKRIFEIAKEYGVKSPEIIELLSKHNINKTNFSSVEESDVAIINAAFSKKAVKQEQPQAVHKTEKPQPSGSAEKAKPAATSSPAKPRPEKTERPSMIVKPIIMTVETNAEGKSTITHNALQRDKAVKPVLPENKPENRAAVTQNQTVNNDGKNKYRNAPNHINPDNKGPKTEKGFGSAATPAKAAEKPAGAGQVTGERNLNANLNRGPQNRPTSSQGNVNRPNQNRDFNRQGQGQGQGFNRQGQGFNKDKDANQGNKFGGNRPGNRNNNTAKKPAGAFEEIPRGKESREKYNKKHEKQLKGSYASRDSRPMRSADHMRPTKHLKSKTGAPIRNEQHITVVRPTMVQIAESINVQEFAKMIKREVAEVIKSLFLLGEMVTINQDIDFDTATLVGNEFGVDVQPLPPEEDPTEIPEIEDDPAEQVVRPPVVTVMGHVDHGKTSLLDAIRKTHVTAREAGGITQHIGAYTVTTGGKKITFLDTPGHEAFTAMRARGAQCTDISVLVVAADDGVMPQTVEAINHSKAAGVPIIVAINKMDKPAANPEHVKQQLSEMELIPEDWGGDTIMVPVSAHSHQGIDDLLEMILLVAEVKELKANPKLPAHGTIVEAKLDKGRGPVATVLVQRGTLTIGDYIIAGTAHGRVRALINDRGEKVRKAGPSTPVEVLGLNEVPQAGDILDAADEKIARGVAEKRIAKAKAEQQKAAKVSLDDIFSRIKEGELKELNIVVKADVQGSVEALCASLVKIQNEEVKVTVVHSGVGAINESDVMLASAANALIIGFNVRPDANARKIAESEKVDIRPYRVIYDAINDVEAAIKGMLAPKFEEDVIGRVEVRQVITISKMIIAGCYVTEGKVTNNAKIRVVRDGIVIAEDEMESLRRFKDDVKEVAAGYECGITLAKFHDIKENDQFEVYVMKEVSPA